MLEPELEKELYKQISRMEKLRFVKDIVIKPTEKDYKDGIMDRYFFRQVNNPKARIVEVDKRQWNSFSNEPFYKKVSLQWRITGKPEIIVDSNLRSIIIADKILFGIKKKLENNLLQFYKF